MKILSTIKKYKELFYMLGIIISSIIGAFLGDGIIWRSQENEREKAKLELAKFQSAKEIRVQIDNLYHSLFILNDDYIKIKQTRKLTKNDSLMVIQRLEYIFDTYDAYARQLATLENQIADNMFMPYPLKDFFFVRKAKILSIQFEPVPIHLFERSPITISVFIVFIIFYSILLVIVTRYIVKKKS